MWVFFSTLKAFIETWFTWNKLYPLYTQFEIWKMHIYGECSYQPLPGQPFSPPSHNCRPRASLICVCVVEDEFLLLEFHMNAMTLYVCLLFLSKMIMKFICFHITVVAVLYCFMLPSCIPLDRWMCYSLMANGMG